jgi:hypothetical protein
MAHPYVAGERADGMSLSSHQWIVIIGIAAAFVIAVGVLASVPPEGGDNLRVPTLSTSTPKPSPNIETAAWWDSMPTAAPVPSMPPRTETPTPIPVDTNTTPKGD